MIGPREAEEREEAEADAEAEAEAGARATNVEGPGARAGAGVGARAGAGAGAQANDEDADEAGADEGPRGALAVGGAGGGAAAATPETPAAGAPVGSGSVAKVLGRGCATGSATPGPKLAAGAAPAAASASWKGGRSGLAGNGEPPVPVPGRRSGDELDAGGWAGAAEAPAWSTVCTEASAKVGVRRTWGGRCPLGTPHSGGGPSRARVPSRALPSSCPPASARETGRSISGGRLCSRCRPCPED